MPRRESQKDPAVRPQHRPGVQDPPAPGGHREAGGAPGGGVDADLRRKRMAEAPGQVLRDAAGRLQPGTAPIRDVEESWKTSFKRWFKDGGQPAAEACRATIRLFNKVAAAAELAIDTPGSDPDVTQVCSRGPPSWPARSSAWSP